MSQDVTYCYDGSFEGFLCCIFESYRNKEVPTAICCDEDFAPTLFAVRAVTTDPDHARRVLRKLTICSPVCANLVRRGFLTCLPEKELYLYRLVAKLLREGPGFLQNFSDETLHPVAKAVQHLNSEAHLLKGFVRFSELGGVLGGEIAPKNRVLPLLRSHFCARYLNESFFLYDRTHKEALFYAGGRAVIRPLEEFQMAPPDETDEQHAQALLGHHDGISGRVLLYTSKLSRSRFSPRCSRREICTWDTPSTRAVCSWVIPLK